MKNEKNPGIEIVILRKILYPNLILIFLGLLYIQVLKDRKVRPDASL